jgi:uncharacterized membrane protein YeiH
VFGELFRVLDLAGVFTNAILGGMVARDKRLDPVGFAALALLSGLGGGIIRDTLLQHGPPIALTDSLYALTAIAGAVVAFVLPVRGRVWSVSFLLIDALALGCWATVGAQKTLSLGLGWLAALLLGTITAVGGGALRDLFVQRIPQIFGGNTLHASCAVVASGVVIGFWYAGLPTVGALVGTAVGAAMCVLARWRGWQLGEGLAWDYAVTRTPARRLPRVSVRVARGRRDLS